MAELDALAAYRRMFATAKDGIAAWWYLGTSFAEIDGYPSLPVLHIETLMIYKTTTLSADAFRMDWWEIGYMRDPTTGEVAAKWLNPVTGETVAAPGQFEEGPSHFIVERAGKGLKLELVQAHARIESVEADVSLRGGRAMIEQVELKVRGFPLPDGTMPKLDSKGVSAARTKLSVFASAAELVDDDVHSSGAYEFQLAPAPWMGFGEMPGRTIVRGIMVKSKLNERLNPLAWQRLTSLFPDCFEGGAVKPRWSASDRAPAISSAS